MATKPVDLKLTAADKKKRANELKPGSISDAPEYPYGTRVSLDEPELKKLGIDDLPKIGAELSVTGTVKVVGTHQDASEGNSDDNRHVDLQITHLAIEQPKKDAMAEMYPTSADAKAEKA